MRIIAGRLRRRRLIANPGQTTRPITDRVKESLFQNIEASVVGSRVLDVFSGTGSMGLEALSRGASGAVFIENDRRAFQLLRENVAHCGVEEDVLCWRTDALRSSYRPKNVPHLIPFDLVFLDPPYKMSAALRPGHGLDVAMNRLARAGTCTDECRLFLRTSLHARFECPSSWECVAAMKFSSMTVHELRLAAREQEDEERPSTCLENLE